VKVITVIALLLGFALLAPAVHAQEPGSEECVEATVVAPVEADAWIDFNSQLANKGSDAVLEVGGDARALVRFRLPGHVPPGCVLESARLRVFADSGTEGARVESVRLASAWSENAVTWDSQPATFGAPVAAWSSDGWMSWNVTAHVRETFGGVNNGWLLRDAAEGTETAGGHGFYAREKGDSPPELVLRFTAPPSGEPRPPEPPTPVSVACGQLVTKSILVTNDLVDCPGDGLQIGAARIIVDLNGHTIDGIGLGTGVRNEAYDSVTVRNGTIADFDHGIELLPETASNVLERLRLFQNEVTAIKLFDADGGNEIRASVLEDNGGGIQLLSGTTGTVVTGNTLTLNSGAALLVRDSDGNRLEGNDIVGGGDLGVGLKRDGERPRRQRRREHERRRDRTADGLA
jgi:parallel beta-helix repeat protein